MVKLSKLFSNGMVIENDGRVWGETEPHAKVDFRFLSQNETLTADAGGIFRTRLASAPYGGPYEMKIGEITLTDVYVGRVWLCGGQSNMELPLGRTRILLDEFITDEPRIHMFTQKNSYAIGKPESAEQFEAEGEWVKAGGAPLDNLFAVPYFFAKELLKHSDISVGLVCAAAGGTSAEAWLPEEEADKFPRLRESLNRWKKPESVRAEEKEGLRREAEWHNRLNELDEGFKGKWESASLDDSIWDEADAITGTGNFPVHGSVWFRKKIVLSEQPQGNAVLFLGRAVDSVTVYVNGRQAFGVGYQYPPCRAEVPGEMFQAGENVIAVRLIGSENSPRFIQSKPYELTYARTGVSAAAANRSGSQNDSCGGSVKINLLNGWKYKAGGVTDKLAPPFWFYEVPTATYYTMLAPVLDYNYEGVIWYQGESNVEHPEDYKELFTAFVKNLRKVNGGNVNLPLIFTQLARYDDPADPGNKKLTAFREEQRKCLEIPNTAMADAYDCGEWNDIHPLDKRTVGKRLGILCQRK